MSNDPIMFELKQTDQGVTVSVCVQVSAAALTRVLRADEELAPLLDTQDEAIAAVRRSLQGAALEVLNAANEELQLSLLRPAVESVKAKT